jgi:hypothetical protein
MSVIIHGALGVTGTVTFLGIVNMESVHEVDPFVPAATIEAYCQPVHAVESTSLHDNASDVLSGGRRE